MLAGMLMPRPYAPFLISDASPHPFQFFMPFVPPHPWRSPQRRSLLRASDAVCFEAQLPLTTGGGDCRDMLACILCAPLLLQHGPLYSISPSPQGW